jgi:hypothetical protein
VRWNLRRFDGYWNTLGRRDPFSAILGGCHAYLF